MKTYKCVFRKIISLENLFLAWDSFKSGKRDKKDVQKFEYRLEENIFQLYRELKAKKYKHSSYSSFYIQDPKQRHIHKANVRDRVLHHAVYNILMPIFEPTFIPNLFSCRIGKGTHKGVETLEKILRKISRNYTRNCFALRCDIKKYFASVDHNILLKMLGKRIEDPDAMWLLEEIVRSFTSFQSDLFTRKGLPIGNLTSQLFANIYLNEFDQYLKHKIRIKHYIRYTDDFIIVSDNRDYLVSLIVPISSFLENKLELKLHPRKVIIRKYSQGIDFLGYVARPHYRVLRTRTKQRIFRKMKDKAYQYRKGRLDEKVLEQSLNSYLGVLSHSNSFKLSQEIKNQVWFWLKG